MASINKAIIVGNLGKEPETRYSQSGDSVTRISVATTYKGKDGNAVTEWHRVIFFGKLAEVAGQYLRKGSQVYVEGSIRTSKYTDKDGIERYNTDIVASQMQMLGSRDDQQAQRNPSPQSAPRNYSGGDFTDDKIPF